LRGIADLVAHAELETYSVLTRLPAPSRADPQLVAEYLRRRHPGARLVLDARSRRSLVGDLGARGLAGGRVYDALIAATAAHHGHELLSCDLRAANVYERLGTEFQLLA